MFEIFSCNHKLLGRQDTLEDAVRCMRVWFNAAYVATKGQIVARITD